MTEPPGDCLHHHLERCDCHTPRASHLAAYLSCLAVALTCLVVGFIVGFRHGDLACKVLVP